MLGLLVIFASVKMNDHLEAQKRLAVLKVENPTEYARIMEAEAEAERQAAAERELAAERRRIEKAEAARRSEEEELKAAEQERVRAAEAAKVKWNEQYDGLHCLSAWDGSQSSLVRAVKPNLRNPGSFEHVRTTITPRNQNNQHTVAMNYRAENGFGGMAMGAVTGVVRSSDCSLVSWQGN